MKKSRARRIVFIVGIGIVLILGAAYYVFRAGLVNERVVSFSLNRLNAYLAGKVSVSAIEGDLLADFEARDLKIYGPSGELMIEARRVKVERAGLSELRILIEGARVKAIKRDGRWNLSGLKKPKPPSGRPMNLPRLRLFVTVLDSELWVSPNPERMVHSSIPLAEAQGETGGHGLSFQVSELRGAVKDPALGVNHLDAAGQMVSTGRGWDFNFSTGHLVTATSLIDLASGHYSTEDSGLAAVMDRIEIAPDTLALFWPNHPLAVSVQGSGSLGGDTGNLHFTANVKSEAGDLNAQGTYTRDNNSLAMAGTMENFSLEKFFHQEVKLTDLTGKFELTYTAAGKDQEAPAERRMKAHLELGSFSYPGLASFPARGDVELTGDGYEVFILSENPGTDMTVSASGSVAEPYPLDLRAAMNHLNLAALRDGLPESDIMGTLKLTGSGRSMDAFAGSGRLRLDSTRVENFQVRQGDAEFSVGQGRLTISRASAQAEGADLTGSGWIEPLKEGSPFDFEVKAELNDPESIAALLGDEVKASKVTAEARVKGDKNRWRATGTARAEEVKAAPVEAKAAEFKFDLSGKGAERIEGSVDAVATAFSAPAARHEQFEVPPLDLEAAIKVESSNPRSPHLSYDLRSTTPDPDFGIKSAGEFSVDSKSKGWALALATLELRVIGQEWVMARAARVESSRGEVRVKELMLASGDQGVSMDGAVMGQRLDARLGLDKFEAGPWAEKLMPGDTVAGAVSARLEVTGSPQSPEIKGEVKTQRTRYRSVELQASSASVNYERDRLHFALSSASSQAGNITAQGMAPVRLSLKPYEGRLLMDSEMDIEIAAPEVSGKAVELFIAEVRDAGGHMALNASLRGTPRNPRGSGKLILDYIWFNVPEWGIAITKARGEADLVDNRIEIPLIVVRTVDGKASIKGNMDLEGLTPKNIDVSINANNFPALNTPDMQAVVDVDLKASGSYEYPVLTGKMGFDKLNYRPPLLLSYQGTSWESEDPTIVIKGEEEGPARSAWLERSEMDLLVRIPDTGQLRSSELNIRFGGQLEVKKPRGGFFLVMGEVQSKEGWVVFQGKPFRVERGIFNFPAIPVIDPSIDILASYKAPDYTTYIKIGGTMSKPTLELYSEPALDQADVLSVILFGKPAKDLAEGQRQGLANSGGQLVAGYAAAGLARSLSDTLNLDTVILQAGESAESSGIGFGKYLNNQLYLFYYHHFGEQAAEEFKLRYEVRKDINIEAGQDEKGQGGIDVYYSHPY
jgi:hypothetical protein